jgi:hypothetical protein
MAHSPTVKPIGIVPAGSPTAGGSPAGGTPFANPPSLQYGGGPVIGQVQVQAIYWGAAWTQTANVNLIAQIDNFFSFIVQSQLMAVLAEYSTPTTKIQQGSASASVTISTSEPGTAGTSGRTVTDAQVQTGLRKFTAPSGGVPAPTPNTIYFVFLPPNVTVTAQGKTSCAASPNGICGYHSSVGNIVYAVIPYDAGTCANCSAYGSSQIAVLTAVASHELSEAITNPFGNAWFDVNNSSPNNAVEIGDICAPVSAGGLGGTFTLGNSNVQAEWSNSRCACLGAPTFPLLPYEGFSNGAVINGVDHTPRSVACCSFEQQLFLFWKADDSSNGIFVGRSFNGETWLPGQLLGTGDSTPGAPACCPFGNNIFLFWQANDPSNAIFFSTSSSGQPGTWSRGQKINGSDATPESPAACVFNNRLFVFWKANDPSNAIHFSSSPSGAAGSWPLGETLNSGTINLVDHTPKGVAACVFAGLMYVFWKADDRSNAIYFSVSQSGQLNSWSPAKRINSIPDATTEPPAAVVLCNKIYLFWKANDPSNAIYYSSYSDVTNATPWPAGQKMTPVDATPAAPSAGVFNGTLQVFWRANDRTDHIFHSLLNG